MRRTALVATIAAAGALALWSSRPPEPARPGRLTAPLPAPSALSASTRPASPTLEPPSRDPFAYGGASRPEPDEPADLTPEAPVSPAPATPLPTPAPLRLAGLVMRGGQLHAALAREGEVVLAAVGGSAFGLTVVSVDVAGGVVLRGPDGLLLRLRSTP